MAYRFYVDTCDRCRGSGLDLVNSVHTQGGRTIDQYDTCRDCGGTGEVVIEEEDEQC